MVCCFRRIKSQPPSHLIFVLLGGGVHVDESNTSSVRTAPQVFGEVFQLATVPQVVGPVVEEETCTKNLR